jgi:hypothetical protein
MQAAEAGGEGGDIGERGGEVKVEAFDVAELGL